MTNSEQPRSDAPTGGPIVWIHDCGERFKPAIGIVRHPDGDRLIKDFSRKPWYIRKTYARFAIRKETKVYTLLEGVSGVPELFGSKERYRILFQYIPGEVLNKKKKQIVPREFYERLEETVRQMHARGVAHGDIRFKNILVTDDWRPFVIDFETAVVFSERSNFIWKRFGRYMQKVDRRSVAKLKKKLSSNLLTPCDQKILGESMPLLSFARKLRKLATRFYKKV